jgi:hypothetical protein
VNRLLFAIVLVGGIAAGLGLSILKDRAASARQSSERAGQDVDLRRELAEVRREMGVMRAGQPPLEALAGQGLASAVPAGEPAKPLSLEERAARDRARNDEIGRVIAAQLKAEPRDPGWSTQTERQVAQALRTAAVGGTQFISAECHTTMCVVTLKNDNIESQRKASFHISRHLPLFSQAFYTYAMNDGVPSMTVYFAREGQLLPRARFDE